MLEYFVRMIKTGFLQKHYILFFMPLLFCILVILALSDFSIRLKQSQMDGAFAVLRESAAQSSTIIKTKLEGQSYVLEAFSAYAGSFESIEDPGVMAGVRALLETSNFYMLGIIGVDGTGMTSTGDRVDISDREYFRKSMKGERAVEYIRSSKIKNEQRFLLSVPVKRGGEVVGVIFGSFTPEDFVNVLVSESYGGNAYVFITDSHGDILASGENSLLPKDASNIFSVYQTAAFGPEKDVQRLRADLLNLVSGSFQIEYAKQQRYIIYSRLGVADWFIFSAVPVSVVEGENDYVVKNVGILTIKLGMIALAAVLVVFFNERRRTALLRREAELLRRSEQSNELLNSLSDTVLFEADLLSGEMHFNHRYEELFGWEPVCRRIEDFAKWNPHIYEPDMPLFNELSRKISEAPAKYATEFRVLKADGQVIWQRTEFTTIYDSEAKPVRVVGKINDITGQRSELEKLQSRAEMDSLTGILNHGSLIEKVDSFFASGGAEEAHVFMLIDVDNLKKINDSFGHFNGDLVLTALAEKLRTIFRVGDMIGRLGGDEFGVLAKNSVLTPKFEAKLRELCSSIVTIKDSRGNDYLCTCSIGVACFRRDGESFIELYKKADHALYLSKENGRGRFAVYEKDAEEEI